MRKVFSCLFVLVLIASAMFVARPAAAASVAPLYIAGNPSCTDLGYAYGTKWDYPQVSTGGTYGLGLGEVTWSTDGTYVDWSSTFGVDAVIVKGGPNANLFVYDPESFKDDDLASPINPNNGTPFGLSHVEFCYDYEVVVAKTAETSYTRSYDWTITKTADQASLLLAQGQTFLVNYQVNVAAAFTDSDFAVAGTITITNPDPNFTATITGVTDSIQDFGAVAVSCPAALPVDLLPGGKLTCSYATSLPSKMATVNTATVVTTGKVGGSFGTANVVFGEPSTKVDECITVTDSLNGELGTVCADAAPATFTYALTLGTDALPLVCGQNEVVNTASFVTNDTGATGSATVILPVEVSCGTGCTLTQGYWKTHSQLGPARYDDNWLSLGALQEQTPFFLSGSTWYKVFWTAPAGNAYYNLAHQYMAAKLNIFNGASTTPEVLTAISQAEAFFTTATPATKYKQATLNLLATILDQYNNGLIGPGHCSE